MADENYSDGEDSVPQGAPDAKDQDEGDQTALVPKSFCKGMSVGDTGRFKVVASHENEMALEYIGDHDDKDEPKPASKSMDEVDSDYA